MKLSEERVHRRIVSLRRGAKSGVLNEVWSVVAEDTATILETLLAENKALREEMWWSKRDSIPTYNPDTHVDVPRDVLRGNHKIRNRNERF